MVLESILTSVSYIFTWTRDSQGQNSADSLAKNTPKIYDIIEKRLRRESVVRGYYHSVTHYLNKTNEYKYIYLNLDLVEYGVEQEF